MTRVLGTMQQIAHRRERVLALYGTKTVSEISDELGVSRQAVSGVLYRAGVRNPPATGEPKAAEAERSIFISDRQREESARIGSTKLLEAYARYWRDHVAGEAA